jgi:solute:Na+ symporter, SSS family
VQTLDWIVLAAYLVAIVSVGVWAGRGNKKIDDFFLAGREMRWWAVGLSVMATQISAITFIGTTGQAYTDGMRFLTTYYGLPFAMVILCMTFVPFFYRARVYTAYQYLEKRFDSRTRSLTSLLFLFSRGLSVGVTLYAPSLVLSVILGRSERETVLLMAGLTIAYVLYGGNRSVIWTDVFQMSVVWFGIFLCLGVALTQLPEGFGVRDALALAQASGKLNAMDTSFSLTKPYTLWTGLIGGTFLALAYFGTDQSQVQRYLSGSSLTQSRLALLFTAFLKVPMQFMILLTGVLVFVFYHFHPAPLLWNRIELQRLESRADPAWMQRTLDRYDGAQAARESALRMYTAQRHAGGPAPDLAPYRRADQEMLDTRTEVLAEVTRLEGRPYSDTNHIFPTYIITHLPRGLAGLVIAVIFAAAMSALSGELNSLATASMVDFYKRFVRADGGDRHEMLVARLLTAGWGGFACLVAMQAGQYGSAIEFVNRLGSYFYGPILGVFLLGTLTRCNATGAFWGLLTGFVTVQALAWWTPVHWLWWIPAGTLTVTAVGLILTRIAPRKATT